MKFAPLYKDVILTVQGNCSIGQDKCSNYTRSIQDYPLWNISINLRQLFFFILPSKNCTLLGYIFFYYTLILCPLLNSYMTIRILIPLIMFERKFCFSIFHYFLNQTNENMINLPMTTYWVGVYGIWVTVQYIYTKCTW